MKLLVINGPNINMLGTREPNIYGNDNYGSLLVKIKDFCRENNINVDFYQSNHEGDLVDRIQLAFTEGIEGIIINPAAYTHTSIALLDALNAVKIPFIEVHISDISKREDFRQISYVRKSEFCKLTISGLGINGYIEAIKYLQEYLNGCNN